MPDMDSPSKVTDETRSLIWVLVGFICGALFGILIVLNRSSVKDQRSYTLEVDNNGDGRVDATLVHEHGALARASHDRNFDGKPDFFEWYEAGMVLRAESDDDFDGKVDAWLTFQTGNLRLSKHDTDKNGIPDIFQYFEHGVVRAVSWRPNGSVKPMRVELYEKAIKVRELRDTNGDGLLDLVAHFDFLENQTSEEGLTEPMQPEDALRGNLEKQ